MDIRHFPVAKALVMLILLAGCAPRVEVIRLPVCKSPEVRPAPDATASVAGPWRWHCCGGRWSGGIVLAQRGAAVRGAFIVDTDPTDAGGTGQYIDGVTDGRRLTFTRRWLNQGRLFSQDYTLELDAALRRATGTFVENHAPGPPSDFTMQRGWEPLVGTKGAQSANPLPDNPL